MSIPTPPHLLALANLLNYSLADTDYKYTGLTEAEQNRVTLEEFADITKWLVEYATVFVIRLQSGKLLRGSGNIVLRFPTLTSAEFYLSKFVPARDRGIYEEITVKNYLHENEQGDEQDDSTKP